MRKIVIITLMALVAAFAFADEALAGFDGEVAVTADTLSSQVLTLYDGDGIDFTVAEGDVLTLIGPVDGEGNAFSAVLTLADGTEGVVTGTVADGQCTLSYTFTVAGECSIEPVEGGTLSVYSYSLEPSAL